MIHKTQPPLQRASALLTAVNFHVNKACNSHCTFCFATFRALNGQCSTQVALGVIDALADAGTQKLNFAGGEPTLRRDLGTLLSHSRSRGLTTSLVTNGFLLDKLLDSHAKDLDWVGLSVDSSSEATQQRLGRGVGDHLKRSVALAKRCRELSIRVKLNTVVTSLTKDENMSDLVAAMAPERWKVFQVLAIKGQNDGDVEPLLITDEQFAHFVTRHQHLHPIVEDNDAMRGSYQMIDPLGRFFGNTNSVHTYSQPILEVGVLKALSQVGFIPAKFEARGGTYDW